jgi:hypothetical protein
VDQIMGSQALLNTLIDGYKEVVPGGRLFEWTIEYAINTTFKSYGEVERLDVTRIDCLDCTRYDHRIFAGTIQFTDLELARNQEPNRKVDILERKLDNGKKSAGEQLNKMLYLDGLGNSGKDWGGLAQIIPDDPTTGTVGGIPASFTFWRSRQTSGAATATPFDNLPSALTSVMNLCSIGGVDAWPTAVVMDRVSFQGYESGLVKIERLVRNDGQGATGGDIGFLNRALSHKGVPLFYDEAAPAGKAYVINSKFLHLCALKGAWMRMKEPVEPGDFLTSSYRVYSFGNLCASARRHLGVVTGIS